MNELIRIPNPMKALVTYVREGIAPSSSWIDPPVGFNVFSGGLPNELIKKGHKPVNSVCINSKPYPEDMSEAPRSTIRVDVNSYGADFEVAGDIDLAVYALFKPLRGTSVKFTDKTGEDQSLYIYSAIPSGSMQMRDPDLDWACVTRPYRIRVSELNEIDLL